MNKPIFDIHSYATFIPEDMEVREISSDMVMKFFDWKMFYAIWSAKYSNQTPEVLELLQLRKDAEEELEFRNFKIRVGIKFTGAYSDGDNIVVPELDKTIPMLRQEIGKSLSLSDFVIPKESGRTSLFGAFAISVSKTNAHYDGCGCPACADRYDDMIGKAVRSTLAKAVSTWIDSEIIGSYRPFEGYKIVKAEAGHASCPDHSLKADILEMIPGHETLGVTLTDSFSMVPESSICGIILIHPGACYPEIRTISTEQYKDYLKRRNMSDTDGRILLSHLLK